MPPALPTLYGLSIPETGAALLGHDGRVSPRLPMPSASTALKNTPPPISYSTFRVSRMFYFELECVVLKYIESGTAQYSCEFPGCTVILPMLLLVSHYESVHSVSSISTIHCAWFVNNVITFTNSVPSGAYNAPVLASWKELSADSSPHWVRQDRRKHRES
jgi:hypothetical protein